MISGDGTATICPRTPEDAIKRCGDAGWLHRHHDGAGGRPPRSERSTIRLTAPSTLPSGLADLAARFRTAVDPGRLDRLARGLGLSVEGLRRLGIGWCDPSRAWSFPMTDAAGRVLGIRLRTDLGKKFAVSGSKEGLFLASDFDGTGLVLIGEGPTDTTAGRSSRCQAAKRACSWRATSTGPGSS